jgi:SAM-dependent methyltransferase
MNYELSPTTESTAAHREHNSGSSAPSQNLLSRARMALNCYPYYRQLLHSLPYAAVRRITRRKCRSYSIIEPFVRNKVGLEIGGPSPTFREHKLIPVYDRCKRIDSCNFSSQTIWSDSDDAQKFGARLGKHYVAEACDLSTMRDGTYDFVLASHVLEHIANPLRALQEWTRVLSPGGVLLVIVPDKRGGFDHKRPFTPFAHIKQDFEANTGEDDLTHLTEILALHDLRLDPPAGTSEQFRERCLRNSSVRAIHHHVFSEDVLARMFAGLSLRALMIAMERPNHVIGFAQKERAV